VPAAILLSQATRLPLQQLPPCGGSRLLANAFGVPAALITVATAI